MIIGASNEVILNYEKRRYFAIKKREAACRSPVTVSKRILEKGESKERNFI